jgi:hypothetical protein
VNLKTTPFHRSIGYPEMRYREEAKQRSCAKNCATNLFESLRATSLLRAFAVKVFGCGQSALRASDFHLWQK